MGVVYRGVDERLGRNAAVKVIAPEQVGDAAFRRRFIEESRSAAAIDHPNVLPVYEAGEEDGVLFLVTRMVDGADLAALLDDEGAMEVRRALGLVEQVGAALDAAHAKGLIHRDVKPANVLVSRDPGRGTEHCYLTDFGLAQQGDRRSRLTTTGQFVGTLDYIAPEQVQGEKVDGRADVYALAALFYECATGAPPFVRDSQAALLFAHLTEPPPPISGHLDRGPEALDAVIARAMAKAPEERFASCTEFVEAARAALAGVPPPALPPRAPGPLRGAATVAEGAGREETIGAGAPAPPSPAAPSESGAAAGSGADVPAPAVGRRFGRRRWALIGAGLGALIVAGVLAWALLGSEGGGGGDGATAALALSTDTVSLTREIGKDTGRLAESVEAGGPSADLVGAFEGLQEEAAALNRRAGDELGGDAPGRGELRAGTGDLEESAAHLALVAAGPGQSGAGEDARQAKQTMNSALTSLDEALAAVRRQFSAEGAAEAASSVQESLAQLRDSREQLIAPFDSLIGAL